MANRDSLKDCDFVADLVVLDVLVPDWLIGLPYVHGLP